MDVQAASEERQHRIPDPKSADAVLRLLIRLAHQVYREYQRQLFDPAFADIGAMGPDELDEQRTALQLEWRRVLDACRDAQRVSREKKEAAFLAADTMDRMRATHAALDAQHGRPTKKTVERRRANLNRLKRKVRTTPPRRRVVLVLVVVCLFVLCCECIRAGAGASSHSCRPQCRVIGVGFGCCLHFLRLRVGRWSFLLVLPLSFFSSLRDGLPSGINDVVCVVSW